jgi:membrane protein YqaA with SNARE-associated domain
VTSLISLLRHWGGFDVLILAALDSSVLPTLGTVDALTILLAARYPDLWAHYAMCSTTGSISGASLAYRLSSLGILHHRIRGIVFDRVEACLKRFGSVALSIAALLPPPFPTSVFVLCAGATRSVLHHSLYRLALGGSADFCCWLTSPLSLGGGGSLVSGQPIRC